MVREASSSGMADVPVKPNPSRKSAFSCEGCRKRKVKCNGASPSCSRCVARGTPCVYSLAPTLSYTKQLEARVAELEDALAKLRNQQPTDTTEGTPSSVASTEASSNPKASSRKDEEIGQDLNLARDFEGLNVEHDGRISFHGPTSLFQLPSGALNPAASSSQLAGQVGERKERLIKNAWRERAIEQMATMPEPFQYLLDSHWCWIQPLFNFVYRPAFTRDMKLNGPYYSDALLNAIMSHSVRWCKTEPRISAILESYEGGAVFSQRAVTGLYDSLKDGYVGIPTIQTLLLLSARECGQGNRTQAWLYSGMAFRMLDDLGITIDSRKYSDSAQLSDEDVEIRNRLFWSCYFWDKMMSLYFGRSPTLQSSQGCPPRTILDDTSELEPWFPHGVVFPEGTHYPPTQAHSTSSFVEMCGLMEILNQILIHIYDHHRQVSESEFHTCVREQSRNLIGWWDELPEHLKLVPNELPPYSPSSHIVTLNCLYHTINILIHRPILCSKWSREAYDKSHLVNCITSATAILSIFGMYRRTFGDSHVVLSIAYSVYTAASIFLLEIQALKYAASGTLDKLKFCILALERVKVSSPVITTALTLIYQEIHSLQVDHQIVLSIPQQTTPQPSHSPTPHSCSPADSSQTIPRHTPAHHRAPSSMSTADVNTGPALYPLQQPMVGQEFDPYNHPGLPQLGVPHHPGGLPDELMSLDNPASYEITPEVFEAFSYAEPIATNMTPDGYGWVGRS
ncbi:C6 transcription factor [Aspergillus pseudoustus]|uniref:C6 transcription factor n=1 Tax=Aspergillus pseudoustus TaxID=1810923 RepID=A0ABR4KM80_9EURO